MKVQLMAVLMLIVIVAAQPTLFSGDGTQLKRSIPSENPEWNQLGWAWGKRSAGFDEVPRRLVRALHPVKKNPDWNDLGFAWGKK